MLNLCPGINVQPLSSDIGAYIDIFNAIVGAADLCEG